jgi:hypothetical protein
MLEISRLGYRLLIRSDLQIILLFIAKTQEELQNFNRFADTGRKYGMEISIVKSQVMRESWGIESFLINVGNKELKEFNHFK